jgi:hypothetical protein
MAAQGPWVCNQDEPEAMATQSRRLSQHPRLYFQVHTNFSVSAWDTTTAAGNSRAAHYGKADAGNSDHTRTAGKPGAGPGQSQASACSGLRCCGEAMPEMAMLI